MLHKLIDREYLKKVGWIEVIAQDECWCETWAYPQELRSGWHPLFKHYFGTQHYWDFEEAAELQEFMELVAQKIDVCLIYDIPKFILVSDIDEMSVIPDKYSQFLVHIKTKDNNEYSGTTVEYVQDGCWFRSPFLK